MVRTTDGQTVVLVETGENPISDVPTIVGKDEDGNEYPLCVDMSHDDQFIDNAWNENSGAPRNQYEGAFVTIIDGNGEYVNPQLIPWLASRGATFTETFVNCFMKLKDGDLYSGIQSYFCYEETKLALQPAFENHRVFLSTYDGGFVVNCSADGFSTLGVTRYTARCSNLKARWAEFCNYCVIKALGVPTTLFES